MTPIENAAPSLNDAWLCGHAVNLGPAELAIEFYAMLQERELLWFMRGSVIAAASAAIAVIATGASASAGLTWPLASSALVAASGTFGLASMASFNILRIARKAARANVDAAALHWIEAARALGRDPHDVILHMRATAETRKISFAPQSKFRILNAAFLKIDENAPAKKSSMGELCLSFAVKSSRRFFFGRVAIAKLAAQQPSPDSELFLAQTCLPEAVAASEALILGKSTLLHAPAKKARARL